MADDLLKSFQYRGLYRVANVPPCVISLEDLKRLYLDLDVKTTEALERHIAGVHRPPNVEVKQFETLKAEVLREAALRSPRFLHADIQRQHG